ncbi:low affinity iron permease family protein [Nocardia asteroides]|uniref:low affinity iron permease family protein n=1 Tax=Nocardia asteroides TaxID=1824 RepID=UPI0036660AB0
MPGSAINRSCSASCSWTFLLQHTTNRANHAVLIKLDELVRATTGARADFLDLEDRQVR